MKKLISMIKISRLFFLLIEAISTYNGNYIPTPLK